MAQAWFRYYRETITDPKFARLNGGKRHLWTVLLCLSDDDGHVELASGVPYTFDELATMAGIDHDDVVDAIEWFQRIGVVVVDDCGIHITNWNKRQFRSDNSTERVKKHRMKRCGNVSVTPPETETDTETDTYSSQKDAHAKKPRKKFTPPTAEDVESYRREKQLRVDADQFIDFYASKGWMIGKTKMKDWKAAVRNWARREDKRSTQQRGTAGGGYTGMTSEL